MPNYSGNHMSTLFQGDMFHVKQRQCDDPVTVSVFHVKQKKAGRLGPAYVSRETRIPRDCSYCRTQI